MAYAARHSPGLGEDSGWPLHPFRDQDSAAVVVGHMVSRHTLGAGQVHGNGPVLGAVQVGVHGLADRVRDGVLLRVLRGLRPCEHAVQVPASVQMTVVVPRLQFIDRVGHCRYVTETGFLLVQTVQKTVVIRLCSSLARSFFPVLCNDRCHG